MASQRQLKTRIRSVKNTKQITKAMQMVAASKMRRAQDATKASHPYAEAANELLAYLASQGETRDHRWFVERPVAKRLIIVVASDRGLAGAYDSNVLKKYLSLLSEDDAAKIGNATIVVGRKASRFAARLKGVEVVGSYGDMPDYPDGTEFQAILNTAKDMFENGEVDAVDVVHTRFVTSMTQVADTIRLFPAGYTETEVSDSVRASIFEPSSEEVLNDVAYRLIGSRLFQALLDARASEYSMRMLAMKNATDNASNLIDDLTLAMNKARQAAITQELSEISAGVEAMK
jgi:F-type H+-transporting ATPase subunit gamma